MTAVAVIGLGEKFLDSRFKASAASTFMVTNAQDSGAGSLRQAILDANANAGPDVINFSIGSFQQTIVLSSLLPVITDPVTIDATTQPGFAGQPLIEVKPDGQVIGDGFKITGGNSVIRGLIINSFRGSGIVIETGGGNVIEGNYIGTDVTGTVQTANIQMGVQILSSNNNRVGGLTTAARNVISGNGVHGVAIATGAANNVVQGNYIGISRTGDFKVQNNDTGVVILNAPNNTIGGTTATARNVIAGNANGIVIDTANGTVVQGNFIGTNAAGAAPIDNVSIDFRVIGSDNTLIGGSTATPGTAPGNVIASLFVGGGVQTRVQGNLIGTNAAGTAQLGNVSFGVSMWGDMVLGGSTPDLRNVISGFQTAVLVANSGGGSILGNYIGTDITGTLKIGNATGIDISSNTPTQIGGVNTDEGNVISGNSTGIRLSAINSIVKGNFIGTRKDGTTALPNTSHGIEMTVRATDNVVGGAEAGAANTIAFNGGSGISIATPGPSFPIVRNRIRGNRIHSNGALGIDLNANGVTLNDAGDADTGANSLQNFPTLTSVVTGPTSTIEGNLNSTANSSFSVDFFVSNSCDPSGFGQGASFVGSAQANTDANGNAAFSAQFPVSLPNGSAVTATATDAVGNTSEFSLCRLVNAPGSVQFFASRYFVFEQDGLATITVSRTTGTAETGSVDYATSNGTALAGSDFTASSGTLTFGPGETFKTFTVPTIDDVTDENTETVNLTLSNPIGLTLGTQNTAVLNVMDNDPPPTISIGDVTAGEGDSGFTDMLFELKLSAVSGKTVSVRCNTFGFSAQSNFDFQPVFNLTVTFTPGETSKTVTVRVIGETFVEPNETFQVGLNSPTNVTLADSTAVGTIIDDDSLLLLTEEGSQRALSLDSALFVTDPFAVVNALNPFSPDDRTRIILFATGLKLAPGEGVAAVTAAAQDPNFGVHPVQVEFVGPVPSFPWLTQVVVKLPDGLADKGSALMLITVHGVDSNKALITIKAP
ncbi:MAG TPA: Calx-beta domain-containing protein [Pyrinomonadaceae bacterium]|nr:Calx-beta domain-containing protein [Pyrinomonadaceae bacterium]